MELRAIQLINAERLRQKKVLGYTKKHDRMYTGEELSAAAFAYLSDVSQFWPWDPATFKSGNRFENLIKAGALYQAAIDQRKARKVDYAVLTEMVDAICAQLDSLLEWAWDAFMYNGDIGFDDCWSCGVNEE